MTKLSKFERTALLYFRDAVGYESIQRIDGIDCFSPLSDFWFWKIRLSRMVKKGLLKRESISSIWASTRHLPWYGITPMGLKRIIP
jgi:hypothetical protein